MDKAILTVGYGVQSSQEMQRSFIPLRRSIEAAFPGCIVRHALACDDTARLLTQSGDEEYTYRDAIARMRESGCEDIRVVPLLLTVGRVYDDLLKASHGLHMGKPLLHDDRDLLRIAGIYENIAADTGRDVLLMGHGSARPAGDQCYHRLKELLPAHVHLACRTGKLRLEDAAANLEPDRGVLLMPLMISAGRHAREEMAGDNPDSSKTRLKNMGFDVEVRLEGMGCLPDVQAMFADKARAVISE